MLFYIDGELVDRDYFASELEEALFNYYSNTSDYDDMLDNEYGDIEILGATFYASNIIKELDSYMYDDGLRDFTRGEVENYMYEFELRETEERFDGYDFESRNDNNPIEDEDAEDKEDQDLTANWFTEDEEN